MSNTYLKNQETSDAGKGFIGIGIFIMIMGIAEAAGRVSLLSIIPVMLGAEPMHFIAVGCIITFIGFVLLVSAAASK